MPTILGQLTHATNVLTHGLEDRIVETGLYASEYLVLRAADTNPDATAADVRRALGMRDGRFRTWSVARWVAGTWSWSSRRTIFGLGAWG